MSQESNNLSNIQITVEDTDSNAISKLAINGTKNGNLTYPEIALNERGPPPEYETAVTLEVPEVKVEKQKRFWRKKKDEKEKKPKVKQVGFFELFRFADRLDIILMVIGTIAAIINGCAFPLNIYVYGNVLNEFISDAITKKLGNVTGNITGIDSKVLKMAGVLGSQNFNPGTTPLPGVFGPGGPPPFGGPGSRGPPSGVGSPMDMDPFANPALYDQVAGFAVFFAIIACGVLVFGYFSVGFWTWTAERQTLRIRQAFLASVLKQDIGWFDTHEIGELNSRLADDIHKIHDGFGEKMATFIQWCTTCIAGYILGFIQGWQLTLVILSLAPLLVACVMAMGITMRTFTAKELKAYAKAGAIAEEVLGAIRTVAAFGGEEKEVERYDKNLKDASRQGIKKGLASGTGMAIFWIVIFGAFGLAFWYGATLVREDPDFTAGQILMVFFAVLIGSMSLGHAAPNIESFSNARGAAAAVFDIIDLVPAIDSTSEEGIKPVIKGNIEFEDVHFTYPSRPDAKVLKGLSFKVDVGQTVALVGSSGCGKSTTVQLLQRFYDPTAGVVKIDGEDLKSYHIKWLRQHIGVVSQEPVLFATTIAENIRYGRDNITQAEIEQAARQANAHDFISSLPERYETMVGERGAQLSGGQKQRIAIARALVRDPKILLLDEATSALDNESEAVVQAALDKAREGRTTIVIAHRLSTIRNADVICGIHDGKLYEEGSHDQLMMQEGLYYDLVMNQQMHHESDSEEEEYRAPKHRDSTIVSDEDEVEELAEELTFTAGSPDMLGMFESLNAFRASMRSNRSRGSRRSVNSRASFQKMKSVDSTNVDDIENIPEPDKKEVEKKLKDPPVKRIMRLNAPEWLYIVTGCFAAIVTGAIHPTFAVIMSEILGIFAYVDMEKQKSETNFYSGMMVMIGVISAVFTFIQMMMFAISGSRLTRRLRSKAFSSMIHQDIAWFDDRKNQVGALTARLASDASQVQGATGSYLATIIQSFSNIGTAIIIAFVFGWKLTLVVLAFLPIMIVCGAIQSKLVMGFSKGDKEAIEEGGKIAIEAIENMRTVASLTKENHFHKKYSDYFTGLYRTARRNAHIIGIAYSASQCVIFFAYAAAFSFGAYLVENGEMEFKNVFRIFAAITFGGMAVGRASGFAPDYGKAKTSAAKMFLLFDRQPDIDSSSQDGEQLKNVSGEITFKDTKFTYPTRKEVRVLRGLDLTVKPGETLALVGASGCGKSTTVQLVERFYDPDEGEVQIDGTNIKGVNIGCLRSNIGLVSQEPVLFDCSIAENIAYGDNSREVSMEEIISAAKEANIHTFISTLPLGYDTNVGDKGTQLSGGQKQRVAIARALVRNPKILLLDEATSALDTESEKVVQEALDRAQVGRSCIVIAHRLSTIQNADKIAVIHAGKVREQGTHSQLLQKQGFYHKLIMAAKKRPT